MINFQYKYLKYKLKYTILKKNNYQDLLKQKGGTQKQELLKLVKKMDKKILEMNTILQNDEILNSKQPLSSHELKSSSIQHLSIPSSSQKLESSSIQHVFVPPSSQELKSSSIQHVSIPPISQAVIPQLVLSKDIDREFMPAITEKVAELQNLNSVQESSMSQEQQKDLAKALLIFKKNSQNCKSDNTKDIFKYFKDLPEDVLMDLIINQHLNLSQLLKFRSTCKDIRELTSIYNPIINKELWKNRFLQEDIEKYRIIETSEVNCEVDDDIAFNAWLRKIWNQLPWKFVEIGDRLEEYFKKQFKYQNWKKDIYLINLYKNAYEYLITNYKNESKSKLERNYTDPWGNTSIDIRRQTWEILGKPIVMLECYDFNTLEYNCGKAPRNMKCFFREIAKIHKRELTKKILNDEKSYIFKRKFEQYTELLDKTTFKGILKEVNRRKKTLEQLENELNEHITDVKNKKAIEALLEEFKKK